MKVEFVASVGVVAADPPASRKLYVDTLGLPLEGEGEDGYYSSAKIPGSNHFGVWPLSQAAQACFGTREWPADRPIPQTASSSRSRAPPPSKRQRKSCDPKGSPSCTRRERSRGGRRSQDSFRSRGRSSGSPTRPRSTTNDIARYRTPTELSYRLAPDRASLLAGSVGGEEHAHAAIGVA